MKYLFLFLLFSSSNIQSVIYNTPTNQYYIIDTEQDPLQIIVLEENIQTNPVCIQNKTYTMKDIDFSNNSTCLMDTINKDFNLNIQKYIDLKDNFSKSDLSELKKMNIYHLYQLLTSIEHSFSTKELYSIYNQLKKNEFRYEIHYFTYFKINDIYYPIAYPL